VKREDFDEKYANALERSKGLHPVRISDDTFTVPSESQKDRNYTVKLTDGQWKCECISYPHVKYCKHQIAVKKEAKENE
jgi:hypothetical protein